MQLPTIRAAGLTATVDASDGRFVSLTEQGVM